MPNKEQTSKRGQQVEHIILQVPSKSGEEPKALPEFQGVYLRSIDYKIEDIEGQCLKNWFTTDFGANNSFDFQAKVKGDGGRAKAKFTLTGFKEKIYIAEDIEVQTNITHTTQGLFKIRPEEISAQVDLGFKPIAGNWFNPYVVCRLPRLAGICSTTAQIGLGGVFHFDKYLSRRAKHQIEVDFKCGRSNDKEVQIKQNLSIWYRNFIFGWYEAWCLDKGFLRSTKLSASYNEGSIKAYGQIELDNKLHLVDAGFGASYKISEELKAFLQTSQPLKHEGKPYTLGSLDLGAGVEVQHQTLGLGAKIGYFHQKKLATVMSFKLNKYFSGSLLFDVG